MRKFVPVHFLLPVVLLALAGCGFNPLTGAVMTNIAMSGATVATYSVTGKSPMDYTLSRMIGKDCDIRNPKRYDGLYCIEGKYQPEPQPPVYCYRTLGEPDCSDRPDPYDNRNQPIVRPLEQAGAVPTAATPIPTTLAPVLPAPTPKPASITTPHAPAHPAPLNQEDSALQGS